MHNYFAYLLRVVNIYCDQVTIKMIRHWLLSKEPRGESQVKFREMYLVFSGTRSSVKFREMYVVFSGTRISLKFREIYVVFSGTRGSLKFHELYVVFSATRGCV